LSLNGTLKALSDPIRRNILTMLKGKKKIAGDIAEELGISPASLSYHLNLLKKNDLVIESKEKNYVYYELNTTLFDELIMWLKQF
jgi:ArsR family transcriptional regulator